MCEGWNAVHSCLWYNFREPNMKNQSENHSKEQLLYDPQPGTAAAAARDFGVDLTLTIENLRLSFEDRIRRNDDFVDAIRAIHAKGRWLKKTRGSGLHRMGRRPD